MAKFGIVVDYYLWDAEKEESYTAPHFLYVDRSKYKIMIFDESLDCEDIDRRLFNTKEEADEYMKNHGWFDKPQCSFENPRVVEFELKLKGETA